MIVIVVCSFGLSVKIHSAVAFIASVAPSLSLSSSNMTVVSSTSLSIICLSSAGLSVKVNVAGGGITGQAEAVRHAMLERGGDGGFKTLTFAGSCGGGLGLNHPQVQYPTSQDNESKVLESVRSTMGEHSTTGLPFAAIVVEPT